MCKFHRTHLCYRFEIVVAVQSNLHERPVVADLIRAEQHNLAEGKLLADLASLPVPMAELCLDTRADPIELQPENG